MRWRHERTNNNTESRRVNFLCVAQTHNCGRVSFKSQAEEPACKTNHRMKYSDQQKIIQRQREQTEKRAPSYPKQ